MSTNEISSHFAKAARGFAEVAEGLSGVLEVLSRTANPDRPLTAPVNVAPAASTVAAAIPAAETKEQPKRGRPAAVKTAEPAPAAAAPAADVSSAPPVTADKLQQFCVSFAKEEANGQAIVKEAIAKHSGLTRLSELTSDAVRGKIFADLTEQRRKLHESRKTETPAADEFDL